LSNHETDVSLGERVHERALIAFHDGASPAIKQSLDGRSIVDGLSGRGRGREQQRSGERDGCNPNDGDQAASFSISGV
jgi:hypothetical protein